MTVSDLLVFDTDAGDEAGIVHGLQKLKIIDVTIEAPDRDRIFQINFSPSIRLNLNSTGWNSRNEGADRLNIEFQPSLETEILVDD